MASDPCPTLLSVTLVFGLLMAIMIAMPLQAEPEDLGNGFKDHGPLSTVATSRGMVCTEDGDGRAVVLVWLFDHRYAYALGVIDAETGEIEEIPRPIERDCPFSSLLSSEGLYYTYFGGHFMEFDPQQREFTVVQKGPEGANRARSMTEDDNGVIWAALSNNSDVVSYDPRTGEFREYGSVYEHPSRQFPQSIAADDAGWVYVGIDMAAGQIIMLNAETGETRPVVPRDEVVSKGRYSVHVYPDVNGRVYGYVTGSDEDRQWYEIYDGQSRKLDDKPDIDQKSIITGSQGLKHRELPNGERVKKLDLIEGRLVVENPETDETREMQFELNAEGGAGMGLAATPDGRLIGGTYIPHRFFAYDPGTNEWDRHGCYTQWNTLTVSDNFVYIGTYPRGVLLEWDLEREWVKTVKDNPDSNPRCVAEAKKDVQRPYAVLAHPDDRHVIMGGMPDYGHTGGGLVFYDRQNETADLLTHEELIPWHFTMTMVALADGKIIGGTATRPANGGVKKAEGPAELYVLDVDSRTIDWHAPLIDGIDSYDDMIVGPEGKVFGTADRGLFFVFDPVERTIVHQADLREEFGSTVFQQGPRIFVQIPDGRIFILFRSGIAELDPNTYEVTMVAEAPGGLGNGGAYVDGRLYFGGSHGAHLWSWEVPPAQ
ncbi:MAG: hypothetical protein R6V19_17690 [Armatimonadota bacterium]